MFRHLHQNQDIRIVLLVPTSEVADYEQEFSASGVIVTGVTINRLPWLYRAAIALAHSGHPASCKYRAYKRATQKTSRLKLYATNGWSRIIYYSLVETAYQCFTRFIASLSRFSSKELSDFFLTLKPDLVFATNLQQTSFDIPILIEAKKRGVITAGTIRAWDNLMPGNFILTHPDYLLLQTKFAKEMGIKYQFFPDNRIYVTGFPYFDWFTKKELILPRKEFLSIIGVPKEGQYIFFPGSGEELPEREIGFAEVFQNAVDKNIFPPDLFFIYRPHPHTSSLPKYISNFNSKNLGSVILDSTLTEDSKLKYIKKLGNADMDFQDLVHFINLIFHSEAVVSPGGTIILEAAAFDKPLILLAFDAAMTVPYWLSFARRYDGSFFARWEAICSQGARVVWSEKELCEAILTYLKNPLNDAEGRERLRERFVYPCDGRATKRLSEALKDIVFEI